MERLQKYLARAGVASRRKSEELIKAGRVKVNGHVVTKPGLILNPPADHVEVDGRPVKKIKEKIYLLLNKPAGYVTTVHDPQNRPKVTDLLKNVSSRIYPVGRLDYQTEGLLLLTNDGELTYTLTHPRYGVRKTYLAWVKGVPSKEKLSRLAAGIMLSDGPTAPAVVSLKKTKKKGALLEITIREGRKHQIKRMCAHIGHPVYKLRRIKFGPLALNGLRPGHYRLLKPEEVGRLRKMAAGKTDNQLRDSCPAGGHLRKIAAGKTQRQE